jgi:hypothetical protein
MQESSGLADCSNRASEDPLSRTAQLPLLTVPLQRHHDLEAFECPRNTQVECFARFVASGYVTQSLGLVFVFQSPESTSKVEAYYTLSGSSLRLLPPPPRADPGRHEFPVTMVGYLGRDHRSSAGTGAALIIDAAKRGYQAYGRPNGVALYAANLHLVGFYRLMGFLPARHDAGPIAEPGFSQIDRASHHMFASYERLILPVALFELLAGSKRERKLRSPRSPVASRCPLT